jgi:hypothetical protein
MEKLIKKNGRKLFYIPQVNEEKFPEKARKKYEKKPELR